ncbi:MAG: signal peptidase I [Elusimicrobia bacterium GWA2_56_46]|nr:MAG: signal peptidase I [Elusimicrobia bacterium GWA2_56_46]OGR55363.1 MAG: signal peptidase I [Elusimicrobia bacterium GWC2_56_31]HBB66609.1 signal peptidase I [Elusimicrobiota bacterium]HBW23696.1 signal peptidase I [Elusimicrobiota bacterium]
MNLKRTLVIIFVTLAAALAIRKYAYEPMYIASESMSPTLYLGQRLILDKLAFRSRAPRRGEIIVFRSPIGEDHESVKRVIAVAGDLIEIRNKEVRLNEEKLFEPYARHTRPDELLDGDNLGPLTVPPGGLFLLGDNRDNSSDSATWKDPATGEKIYFLPLTAVTGKIRGIY